eukprot:TRINITY_DN2484_c0_g1_i2.p1 TRINITY_DN2484_c0_g1~~TRINITY_DN2484_c0_g1_i2.p1  ORF type:complete len:279 (+),score=82.49 TRINITY_DN2484_c0_g1_i2:42-878(+)
MTGSIDAALLMGGFEAAFGLVESGQKGTAEGLCALAAAGKTVECCLLIDLQEISVDAKDGQGVPAAVLAAKAGHFDTAMAFYERGADANACGPDGLTSLCVAAEAGHTETVKALVLFGAKDAEGKAASAVPASKKQIVKEINRAVPAADKLAAMSEKFKAQGNKVFGQSEFAKATKLYSAAVSHQPKNHVPFSNRSACLFNNQKYLEAFSDACRCVNLNPKWAKGYFRKGSCLHMLKQPAAALQVCNAGLKVEKGNADLKKLKVQLEKETVGGKKGKK